MALDIIGLARSLTATGFAIAGNLPVPLKYVQTTNPQYDPSNGTQNPVLNVVTVNTILLSYSQDEIDGRSIIIGDQKAIVQISELNLLLEELEEGSVLQLSEHDYFTSIDGVTEWEVKKFSIDPTGSVAKFQLRKKGV